jgi:predicted permease
METLLQDVRYALRMLRKSPGFSAVAVIIIALGIGANTAIFTLTYALMYRSLPVPQPNQLVRVTFSKPDFDFGLSGPMFDEIKKRQQVFTGLLAWHAANFTVTENDESPSVRGAFASGDALTTLGVRPELGRNLLPSDDQSGGGRDGWASVISYDYWRSHFNQNPSVIGKSLVVEGIPVTVVGVMPAGFEGPDIGTHPDLIMPLEFEVRIHGKDATRHHEGSLWLTVMGRLKPGATVAQARADILRIAPQVFQAADTKHILDHGFFAGCHFDAVAGRTGRAFVREQYGKPLLVLQVLVGLILFIACTNLAGLVIARTSNRRRELAVRIAVGAPASRLIRQLCTETSLIVLFGSMVAFAFARVANTALLDALMGPDALFLDLRPDLGVLLFTGGITALAALFAGLIPAISAVRSQPALALKQAGATAVEGSVQPGRWLVVIQTGVSVLVVVAAALFASSFYRLLNMNPGFRSEGVIIIPTDLHRRPETGDQLSELYQRVLDRLQGMSGIQTVSAEAIPLLSGWTSSTALRSILPDGSSRQDDDVSYNRIGPAYFAAMGSRLIAGREFLSSDRAKGSPVCILNQSAAQYFFPNANPVGSYLSSTGNSKQEPTRYQVVGVVEDAKYTSLRTPAPRMVYKPFLQERGDNLFLIVRTDNIAQALASVRGALLEFAPGTPALTPITMRAQLHLSIGQEQTTAMLATFFALIALLLTAIGVYGLLAYQVSRRTAEIGIRIALGARPSQVSWIVLREALLLVGIGVVIGALTAAGTTRWIASFLYGTKTMDPYLYATAIALMLTVAFAASWIPARQATRVDPMRALRSE